MLFTRIEMDAIVGQIRIDMQQWWNSQPESRGPISHYCLWWAYHTVKMLNKLGVPAQIQAGSAFWRCCSPEKDDGVCGLNWGFEFEWNQKSRMELLNGLLPEMHVWAAIIASDGAEIIDLTAKYFKPRSIAEGFGWSMPDPPDYLWVDIESFPIDCCNYMPSKQACHVAHEILNASQSGGMMVIKTF